MPKISFILASRDDNYESAGIEGYTMKRLNITLGSLLALNVDSEIIVVEFCPSAENKPLKDSIGHYPVKILTVKKALLDILQADDPQSKLSFYECLAKDIGAKHSQGEFLAFCNADNIYPSLNFDEVIKDLESGFVVTGVRNEIPKEYGNLDTPTLINMAERGDFKVITRFTTAAGDFTACRKGIYEKIGGYRKVHGIWHSDNFFLDQAKFMGYERSNCYSYYHLNHNQECLGVSDRSHDWPNFKPINPKIIRTLDEFVAFV